MVTEPESLLEVAWKSPDRLPSAGLELSRALVPLTVGQREAKHSKARGREDQPGVAEKLTI